MSSLNSKMPDSISGIVQDKTGYLWIATFNGLYRYDGRNYKSFKHDPRDNNSLSDNLVISIHLLPNGSLLLATAHGGIVSFNPKTETFDSLQLVGIDFNSVKVQSLLVDGDNYWIGTFQGLMKYNTQTQQITRYIHNPLDEFALPGRLVNSVIRDKSDQLWVGTDSGLAILNTNTDEFTQFPLEDKATFSEQITTLYLDTDGSVWVGTEQQGLFHITGAGSRIEQVKFEVGKLWVREILRLKSGELWVATDNGVYVVPAFGNPPIHYQNNSGDPLSLGDDDVWTIYQDESDLVIIGTTKGLYKSAPDLANFRRMLHGPLSINSLSNNYITGIAENKDGQVLFSTLSGLDVFSPVQNQIRRVALPLTRTEFSNRLQSILVDNIGRVWLGDSNGHILILDNNYRLLQTLPMAAELSGVSNKVLFIHQTSSGDIWIGSERKLIRIASGTFSIARSFEISGGHILEHAASIDMVEDSEGFLWFATRGAGLIKYNPKTDQGQRFYHQSDQPSSLTQDTLNNLYIDAEQSLWIASTNGLNRLTKDQTHTFKPTFETWLENDGLSDADIRGIRQDALGWLWLSTGSGLSRINLQTKKIENFSEEDGLQNSSFSPRVVLASHQGDFYFGSNLGVSVISPENFKRNLFLPKLAIVEISIRQGPWQITSLARSTLEHDHNDVQFKIAAFDFHQPYSNYYRYRLVGNDLNWSDNQTSNLISYTNLSSGYYRLEVQGTNNDGFWSKDTATYSFSITPPWWGSQLSYALYFLIFISFVYWLYLNHKQSLRKERAIAEHLRRNDKLKDEFLAVISHELRTPLTGIIGISEAMMAGSSGALNDRTQKGLGLIVNSGKRLASLVNEILDFKKLTHKKLKIQLDNVDLRSAVQVVSATCQPLIENKPINLRVEIADDIPNVYADSNRLLQILYNLVGNAIKFTVEGTVTIRATNKENQVEVMIEDTGIGIPKEHLGTIFLPFEQLELSTTREYMGSGLGLAITSLLVELHASELKVDSAVNVGSRFYFCLDKAEGAKIINRKPQEDFPLIDSIQSVHLPVNETAVFNNQPQTGPLIIVADDEALNRTVICEFLNLSGYRTIEADCGEAAYHLSISEHPDLVILDVMMPKISGYDVCRELRKQFSPIELPVLLISAHSEPQDIVAGFDAGANDYISKPVEKNVLLARTRTLVMLGDVKRAHQEADEKLALQKACHQLSRYFPRALVERLLNHEQPDEFEASRRLITVLFADLVGFTELTDRFEAEVITDLLNQFIHEMNHLIESHQGVLNEVMGDGLLVLIGAPAALDKHSQAQEAVKLSIAMQMKMKKLGKDWLAQGLDHNVKLRIGLHQDFATVGNIGAENLIAYRAIGSGVNLASRLQADCPPGFVRLTYPIYALTRETFIFQTLEECHYKGFHHPHRVCTLDPEINQFTF